MPAEVLVIASDFNFHLDNPLDAGAAKFTDLLDTFGLVLVVSWILSLQGRFMMCMFCS